MPSKQHIVSVEELVHEIKENLRLKARPSHSHGRNSRPSPYHVPCRSWNDQNMVGGGGAVAPSADTSLTYKKRFGSTAAKDPTDIDDPYELLQALIQSNNLVKEAVRRLQLSTTTTTNHLTPKRKSCYYDSDDESCASPRMFKMCQLEL